MDPDRTKRWLGPMLIVGCVLLVFGRAVTHDFQLWDDGILILDNPAVRDGSLWAIPNAWKSAHQHLYIPLTYNAWNLLARVGATGNELSPAVFHGANIVMHAVCALLVYRLALALGTGKFALVAGLLFALHPLQVEPVAWASGMKDLLSNALALLAAVCYVLAAQEGRRRLYAVSAAAALLATFAKPAVAGLPIMLLLIDRWVLKTAWRASLIRVIPIVLAVMPVTLLTPIVQPAESLVPLPLSLRPAVAADALAFYAWKIVWPVGLCTDYGQSPENVMKSGRALWTWIIPLSIAAGAMLAMKRRPLITCGLGIAFVGFLPVLGLVPFGFQYYSTTADRYAYLPLMGISLAIAGLLQDANRRYVVAASAIIFAMGMLSFLQIGVWRDTETLESNSARINPTSPWSRTRLAVWHGMKREFEQAERESLRSLTLRYDYVLPMNNVVTIQLAQGKDRQAIRTAECMQRIAAIWHIPDEKLEYGRKWTEEGRRLLRMPVSQTLPSSP